MGAIKINNVGKIYPNGTRALEDVDIEIMMVNLLF